MKRWLYVMVSRTDTRMGRMIRCCTHGVYNHVSLGLDLGHFVSFARYRQDVPLAGGYVSESPQRLLSSGHSMPVRIFRLEISEAEHQQLQELFAMAVGRRSPLIYNSLGALLTSCHVPCPVPGAYTCLDFAGALLGRSFPSIDALADALSPWEYYQGELADMITDDGSRTEPFFCNRGLLRGTKDTATHFSRLLGRVLRLQRPLDPISTGQFDILHVKNAVSG